MTKKLDHIHHLALQVEDIESSISWYRQNFLCEIAYQDDSWALLTFDNLSLALVLPNQHPTHFAITRNDPQNYGQPKIHRDGTSSVYITDPAGNNVEILKLAS